MTILNPTHPPHGLDSIAVANPSFHVRPWGGELLAEKKGRKEKNLGETWEVCLLSEGPSGLNGVKANELIKNTSELPYIVKFLDAADFLSVQVHPTDEYAKKNEGTPGKTECWAIVEVSQDKNTMDKYKSYGKNQAGIFLGIKSGVTKQQFFSTLESRGDITQLMNFYPVTKGEFYYVPAGTIHAIGPGITLVEVQQSCGLTYRVWDWNRVDAAGKSRELHIEKAKAVVDFEPTHNNDSYFSIQKQIYDSGFRSLIAHSDFQITSFGLKAGQSASHSLTSQDREVLKRHQCLILTKGSVLIKRGYIVQTLHAYQTILLPYGWGRLQMVASEDCEGILVV